MAGKTLQLGIVIGATLAGSFGGTFKTVKDTIGDTQKKLDGSKSGEKLADNVIQYKRKLNALGNQQEQIGKKSERLWEKTAKGYAKATRAAEKYGINVGDVVRQHRLLGDSASVAERKLRRLSTLQNNRNKRQELQGKILTTVGLAYSAAAPLKAAIEFESVMANVNKVVDFDSPAQFKTMQKDILALSTVIPLAASGFGDIMEQAGQAGIARNELLRFAEDAAKMGVAFDMSGKQAGSAMTGLRTIFHMNQDDVVSLGDTYNHLSNNMDATARDMINIANRSGAAATMFGLNGKQVGALGATFLATKTPVEIAGTSMKAMMIKLATADQQGAKFQQTLANIGMSAGSLKQAIKEDGEGAIISFLEAVKNSDDVLGNLSGLFGMEYSGTIAKLVDGLEGYKRAAALASDETASAGSMLKEYEVRSKTTSNEIQLFRNQLTRMGITIGSVLLPALRSTLGLMGKQISTLADLSDRYPQVTKFVVGAAIGLVTFKVAALAAGYAATILSDGWTFAKGVFDFFRLSTLRVNAALITNKAIVIGAAVQQKAVAISTGVVTAAQWAWNAALLANPIGATVAALVVAGVVIGAVAVTIYKYWQPIGAFFSGIWQGIVAAVAPAMSSFEGFSLILSPIVGLFSGIGSVIGWVADLFGGFSQQVEFSQGELQGFTDAGAMLGVVVGAAFRALILPITLAGDAIKGVVGLWDTLFGDDEKIINTVINTDNVVAFKPKFKPLALPVEPVVNTDNVVAFKPAAKQADSAVESEDFSPLELPKKVANGSDVAGQAVANQTNNISIQIQQQPGEDANALASRVVNIIERKKSASQRGAMYD